MAKNSLFSNTNQEIEKPLFQAVEVILREKKGSLWFPVPTLFFNLLQNFTLQSTPPPLKNSAEGLEKGFWPFGIIVIFEKENPHISPSHRTSPYTGLGGVQWPLGSPMEGGGKRRGQPRTAILSSPI